MTNTKSENSRVTRAAGVVGAATLLSRIFGFIRDVVIAWFFGAGISSDAFFVAFRIPNLLRRLFAEGSLSIAFIPVFTEYLETQGKDEAFHMGRSAIRLLSLILAGMTILGILLSPWIVRIIAPGFADIPEKLSLTISLTRIMFPYMFFICLAALFMGILNALGHFAAPALAPVFLNIAMIASVFMISPFMADPVTGLAIGVLIGGALQLILQMPFLIKKGLLFWKTANFCHPGLKRVGILMIPAVVGATVHQFNILVGTLLASLLPEGSVSYLYYADRLVEFPLGVFAIATATAVLPSLSKQAAVKDFKALSDTFGYAMNLVFFITIPSMVGLIVLREPIVALLFKRGAFDIETTRKTAEALLYYSVGLWAFSAVRIVVSTFYALQDTKTPMQMAVISIVANIGLSILLMGPLKHGGLALATSLASMLNLGLLIYKLRMKIGALKWGGIFKSTCKSAICSAIMGLAVWAAGFWILPSKSGSALMLLLGVIISIIIGCILYALFSFLLKSRELATVLAIAGVKRDG
jgi:putative peptidoglycan lipid II flippase